MDGITCEFVYGATCWTSSPERYAIGGGGVRVFSNRGGRLVCARCGIGRMVFYGVIGKWAFGL